MSCVFFPCEKKTPTSFLCLSAVFLSDPTHIFCHSHCNLFQLCIHNLLAICFRIDICGKTLFDCTFEVCTLATQKMNNFRIDCPLKNAFYNILLQPNTAERLCTECVCSKVVLIFEFLFLNYKKQRSTRHLVEITQLLDVFQNWHEISQNMVDFYFSRITTIQLLTTRISYVFSAELC